MRREDAEKELARLPRPDDPVVFRQEWWEICVIGSLREEIRLGRPQQVWSRSSYSLPGTNAAARFLSREDAVAECQRLNANRPEGVERYVPAHAQLVVTLDERSGDSEAG